MKNEGFHHSAFALNHESLLHKSSINISAVPPGALITLLQKGLQYVEVEWHLTEVNFLFLSFFSFPFI